MPGVRSLESGVRIRTSAVVLRLTHSESCPVVRNCFPRSTRRLDSPVFIRAAYPESCLLTPDFWLAASFPLELFRTNWMTRAGVSNAKTNSVNGRFQRPNAPRPVSAGRGIHIRTERRADDYYRNHRCCRDCIHGNDHRSDQTAVSHTPGMFNFPGTLLDVTPNFRIPAYCES